MECIGLARVTRGRGFEPCWRDVGGRSGSARGRRRGFGSRRGRFGEDARGPGAIETWFACSGRGLASRGGGIEARRQGRWSMGRGLVVMRSEEGERAGGRGMRREGRGRVRWVVDFVL